MTVLQFQMLYGISELDLPEFEKATEMVKVMTGLTDKKIERMSMRRFNRICSKVSNAFKLEHGKPARYLRSGKRLYKVHLEIRNMNAARYVEGVEYGKDIIMNLHKILATMVQPCTWYGKLLPYDASKHEQYADDMLNVDFLKAYSCGVFFCSLFSELMRVSQPYMIQQLKSKGLTELKATKHIEDLQSVLDGLAASRQWQNMKGLN